MRRLPKANGNIRFTRQQGVLFADWIGGPVVEITPELMRNADSRWWKRTGNELAICQFKLAVLGQKGRGNFVAKRMDA
jgi:hypothetical protein